MPLQRRLGVVARSCEAARLASTIRPGRGITIPSSDASERRGSAPRPRRVLLRPCLRPPCLRPLFASRSLMRWTAAPVPSARGAPATYEWGRPVQPGILTSPSCRSPRADPVDAATSSRSGGRAKSEGVAGHVVGLPRPACGRKGGVGATHKAHRRPSTEDPGQRDQYLEPEAALVSPAPTRPGRSGSRRSRGGTRLCGPRRWRQCLSALSRRGRAPWRARGLRQAQTAPPRAPGVAVVGNAALD
jgi:hypothetical protein